MSEPPDWQASDVKTVHDVCLVADASDDDVRELLGTGHAHQSAGTLRGLP